MKHILPLGFVFLAAACSHTPPASSDQASDGSGHTDVADSDGTGGITLPGGLFGTAPAKNLPAPEFNATNSDGSARHRDDLMGAPHVMWFFPLSGTAG